MAEDFLARLLGDKNRARVIRVLVFNQGEPMTTKELGKRAGVSARALLSELTELARLGIVKKGKNVPAPKKAWRTKGTHNSAPDNAWLIDPDFKHARPLTMFVKEVSPVQHEAMLEALKKAGKLSAVILSGTFVGDPTRPADLVVAGDSVNQSRLDDAIRALEPRYGHEIRYASFTTPEFRYRLTIEDRLIRDTLDFPHVVLLNRGGLL